MRKVIFNICLATIVNILCFEMNQIVKSNKLEESCEESSSIEGVDCGCKKKIILTQEFLIFLLMV